VLVTELPKFSTAHYSRVFVHSAYVDYYDAANRPVTGRKGKSEGIQKRKCLVSYTGTVYVTLKTAFSAISILRTCIAKRCH
jgi:hypothetical protein